MSFVFHFWVIYQGSEARQERICKVGGEGKCIQSRVVNKYEFLEFLTKIFWLSSSE